MKENRMRLETKIAELIKPLGATEFRVVAYELTHDGMGWSVNTPFCIGTGDAQEVESLARARWNVFRANYAPKATVRSLDDIAYERTECEIEADGLPFLRIEAKGDE